MAYVDDLMRVAKETLMVKRDFLEKMTTKGLYPYSKFYLRQVKELEGKYWSHHFNTIGLIGMSEGLLNFMGEDISTPDGKRWQSIMNSLAQTSVRRRTSTATGNARYTLALTHRCLEFSHLCRNDFPDTASS